MDKQETPKQLKARLTSMRKRTMSYVHDSVANMDTAGLYLSFLPGQYLSTGRMKKLIRESGDIAEMAAHMNKHLKIALAEREAATT